jgi:hypothetical protein
MCSRSEIPLLQAVITVCMLTCNTCAVSCLPLACIALATLFVVRWARDLERKRPAGRGEPPHVARGTDTVRHFTP